MNDPRGVDVVATATCRSGRGRGRGSVMRRRPRGARTGPRCRMNGLPSRSWSGAMREGGDGSGGDGTDGTPCVPNSWPLDPLPQQRRAEPGRKQRSVDLYFRSVGSEHDSHFCYRMFLCGCDAGRTGRGARSGRLCRRYFATGFGGRPRGVSHGRCRYRPSPRFPHADIVFRRVALYSVHRTSRRRPVLGACSASGC